MNTKDRERHKQTKGRHAPQTRDRNIYRQNRQIYTTTN